MLEYDIEEAQSLLKEKLALAESNLSTLSEDLEFLRLQITTMEVSKLGFVAFNHGTYIAHNSYRYGSSI